MKYEGKTKEIIKCAFEVHNVLGFGFLEKVYENAFVSELKRSGFKVEQQKLLNVYYKDEIAGEYFADIVVDDEIIIEVKSVNNLAKEHEIQLVNYLSATKKDIGLLINFSKSVEVKRKTRILENGF